MAFIDSISGKDTPVGADKLIVSDSEDSNNEKSLRVDKLVSPLIGAGLAQRDDPSRVIASAESTHSIVFIDDDVKIGVMTDILPLMQSRNIPYVFAVPTNLVGSSSSFCDEADLETLAANGGEMVAHSHTHAYLRSLTNAQVRDEMVNCKDWLWARGYHTHHMVYPYSDQDERIRSITSEYFESANAGYSAPGVDFDSLAWPRLALGAFQGANPAGYQTTQELKDAVDVAMASDGMLVFMTHVDDVGHGSQQQADLEAVIDYCIAQGAKIRNWSDAWKINGNAWQSRTRDDAVFNPSRMNCKGQILANLEQPRKTVDGLNTIDNTTPPSDYPDGTYHILVPFSAAAGFPATAGTLVTRKTRSNIGYSHQTFYEFNGDGVWNRTAKEGDTWGSWIAFSKPLAWKALDPRAQFQPQSSTVDGSGYMTTAAMTGFNLSAPTFDATGKWARSGNWNEMVRGAGTGVDAATGEFKVDIPSLEKWTMLAAIRISSNPAAISTAFSIGNNTAAEAAMLIGTGGDCRMVGAGGTLAGSWVTVSTTDLSVVGISWDGSTLRAVMPDGSTASLSGATQADPATHVRLSGKVFSWDGCPINHGGFTLLPLALSQSELQTAQTELKLLHNH